MFGSNWMGGGAKKVEPPANGGNAQNNAGGNNAANNPGNGGNNSSGNADPNKQNNSGPNTDLIDNIWNDANDPGKKTADDTKTTQTGGGNQQNDPNNPPDPGKQVSDYLNTQGLGDFKLTEAETTALKSGEGFPELVSKINERIQTAHIKALSNASQLIDNKVKSAVEAAVNQSKSFYHGEQIRGVLNEKIPMSKDPAFGPVIETVLRRFLEKDNMTLDKGIEYTKTYLQKMSEKFGSENVNNNTRQNFRGPSENATGGNTDWISALRGQ